MTKDEQIAWLMKRVEFLEAELRASQSVTLPSPGALRMRRFRARKASQEASLSDVTSVTHPLESDLPTFLQENVTKNGSPQERVDKTHTEPASLKRHNVTPVTAIDFERAEADAASRGLIGAAFGAELQRFHDYWDSAGWKRKNGPVKDRNATWRTWLDSPYRQGGEHRANGNGHKPHQDPLAGLREWNEEMDILEGKR